MGNNSGHPGKPGAVFPDDVPDVQKMEGILEFVQGDEFPHDLEIVQVVVEDPDLIPVVGQQWQRHLDLFIFSEEPLKVEKKSSPIGSRTEQGDSRRVVRSNFR